MAIARIAITTVHVITSLIMVLFILLHSGRGTGLSDMFGGGSMAGGAGSMEKNLDRITVAAAVIFSITTILLGLLLS